MSFIGKIRAGLGAIGLLKEPMPGRLVPTLMGGTCQMYPQHCAGASCLCPWSGLPRIHVRFPPSPVLPVTPGKEESVKEFIVRNLGDEVYYRLIEPFCSGVYAGDPTKLSMQAAFNRVGGPWSWPLCLPAHIQSMSCHTITKLVWRVSQRRQRPA